MSLQEIGEVRRRSRCGICDFVNASNEMRGKKREEELKRRTKMSRGKKWLLSVYCCSMLLYVIMLILSSLSPQVAATNNLLVEHSRSSFEKQREEEQASRDVKPPRQVHQAAEEAREEEAPVEETTRTLILIQPGSKISPGKEEVKKDFGARRRKAASRLSTLPEVQPRVRRMAPFGLIPINELRVSGSKSEPPSRPTVDWSKQRPYFGPDMARNVSVELGKTAYLTCKVYELGDKTVSWLRPRENEILTAGRFTYIGDSRFASINDNGSHDWILEIKDVGLNDSTSYECQISTDPKMSAIINLQVKAAKAKIKQGEQYYAPSGSNIEFTCDISHRSPLQQMAQALPPNGLQQTYWYYNGNLLNYARSNSLEKNFSIEWDSMTQTSRFKLFNVQLSDAGNYSCKPTSAEPTTIRLHVKRINQKIGSKDRTNSYGFHNPITKEAQKTRHNSDSNSFGLESTNPNVAHSQLISSSGNWVQLATLTISCLLNVLMLPAHQH